MNRLFLPDRAQKWAANRLIVNCAGGPVRMLGFAAPLLVAALLAIGAGVRAQGPHFSHQTIFVTDLDRAANFYEKVMELKRIPEPFHDGKHVWFRISGHGQLHVVSGAKEDIPHDINIHLAFSVPDMAVFTKHLDENNIKYGNWAQNDKTPQLRPDKVQQVYLQDPDGYWIEVNDDKF
jgi:lactoylglutathione lyase